MKKISSALKYYYLHKDKLNEKRRKLHITARAHETEYRREYRKTEKGREATRRAIKKYESKNKVRRQNWGKVQKIKSLPCIICGKLPTHKHHPDIAKPMEIIFLCPLHHKEIHKGI